MTRADPQFKLRMPLALKEHIEESAAQNKRSVNAEIVSRLEESYFDHDKSPAQKYTEQQIVEMVIAANAKLLERVKEGAREWKEKRDAAKAEAKADEGYDEEGFAHVIGDIEKKVDARRVAIPKREK